MAGDFDSFLKKMMGESEPETTEAKRPSKKKIKVSEPEVKSNQKTIVEDIDDDDIIEHALEYASTFAKIVKKNFPGKSNRRIVLESVRGAINLMLGEAIQPVQKSVVVKQPKIEKNEEKDPYDIMRQIQLSRLPEGFNDDTTSKNDLNIKGVVNEEGQTEIDLSQMSESDKHTMRVLSGIESPRKQEVINE